MEPVVINRAMFCFPRHDITPPNIVDDRNDRQILNDIIMILNNQLCAADYKYFSEFLCRDIAEKMQTDCFYATRKTIEAAIKQWTEENRNNPDVDLDRFLKKTQKTLSNNTNDKENDRKLNEILKEGSRKVMAQKLHDKVLREAAHTQIKASSKGTSTRKAGRAVSKAVKSEVKQQVAEIMKVAPEVVGDHTENVRLPNLGQLPFLHGAVGSNVYSNKCIRGAILLDCGASHNCLPVAYLDSIGISRSAITNYKKYVLNSVGSQNDPVTILGEIVLTVVLTGRGGAEYEYSGVFLVLDSNSINHPLLSVAYVREGEGTIFLSKFRDHNRLEIDMINSRERTTERAVFPLTSRERIVEAAGFNEDPLTLAAGQTAEIRMLAAIECGAEQVRFLHDDNVNINRGEFAVANRPCDWEQDRKFHCFKIKITAKKDIKCGRGEFEIKCNSAEKDPQQAAQSVQDQPRSNVIPDVPAAPELTENMEEDGTYYRDEALEDIDNMEYKIHSKNQGLFSDEYDVSYINKEKRKFDTPQVAELSHLSKEDAKQVQAVLDRYPDAVAKHKHDVGRFTGFSVPIVLKPNAVISERPRGFNKEMQEGGDENIDHLLAQDVIEHTFENVTKHRSNLHIVHKPASTESHGSKVLMNNRADKYILKHQGNRFKTDKYRTCTDFRVLNSQCESAGRIVLPSHQEVRQRVRGKYINQLDLSNGYFNMPLTEESRAATTFYWRHRGINKLFRFKTCTMGWINSSYWFQEMVQYCLRREHLTEYRDKHCPDFDIDYFLSHIIIYSDDILTLSSTRQHSLRDLDAFFYCMNKCNIKINAAKSSFATQEFIFLGHHFNTKEGEQYSCMTHSRAAAIVQWRVPSRSLSEIYSRLSILGWYCNLIPALKLVAARLYCMLAEKNPVWDLEAEKCWNNIKFLVTLGIKLSLPDDSLVKCLFLDSSCVAWSSVLMQLRPKEGDRLEYMELISCFSRLLGRNMMNRAILNKEQHTITAAVAQNESYIRNSTADVFVASDASVTVHILRAKQPNCDSHAANFESCAIYLSTFSNLKIINIPGSSNALSDFLTRTYVHSEVKRRRTLSDRMCEMTPAGLFTDYQVLSNDLLRSILLGQANSELIDCSPREYKKTKSRIPTDYIKYLTKQSESDETELFRSVIRGFGSININARIWDSYVNAGRLHSDLRLKMTEPKLKTYIRKHKLGEIREAVKKLPHIYGDIESETVANINFAFANFDDEILASGALPPQLLGDESGLCPAGGVITDPQLHQSDAANIFHTDITGWSPHIGGRSVSNQPLNNSEYSNSLRNWYKQVSDLASVEKDPELQTHLDNIKAGKGGEMRRREMDCIMKILYARYKLSEADVPDTSAQLIPVCQDITSEVTVTSSDNGIDFVTAAPINLKPHDMIKVSISTIVYNPTRFEPDNHLHIDDARSFSKLNVLYGLNSIEFKSILIYTSEGLNLRAGQKLLTVSNLSAPHSELSPGKTRYMPVFVSKDATMCGEERQKPDIWTHITDLEHLAAMTVRFTEIQAESTGTTTEAEDRSLWEAAEERGVVRRDVKVMHTNITLDTLDRSNSEPPPDPSEQQVNYYPTNSEERKELNRLLFVSAAVGCNALLSPSAIKNIQRTEPWIKRIAQSIEGGESSIDYVIKDDVLYRRRKRLGAAFDVLVIPGWLAEMLAETYHREQKNHDCSITSTHYQQNTLREMLELHYYTRGMEEICIDAVRNCNSCRLNQLVRRRKHHGLQRSVISSTPNSIQCADIISGLPNSYNNCTNMLLISDRATGLVFGSPLKGSLTSGNILRALMNIWAVTDAPKYFLSDHGSVFGAEVDNFMKRNGIQHIKNTPTRSQATDTESRIKVAKEYLMRSVESWDQPARRSWDTNIMYALIHMNRTLSRGSTFSKYDLNRKAGRYFTNPAFDFDEDVLLEQAIQKHLGAMVDKRENAVKPEDKSISNDFKVGQLVSEPTAKPEHKVLADGSRAFQNNSINVYQVLGVTPTMLRCVNLLNGHSKNILIEKAKLLTIPQKIKFNQDNESALLSRWRRASQRKIHGDNLYKMIRSEDDTPLHTAELSDQPQEPEPVDIEQEYEELPSDPGLEDTGEPDQPRRGARERRRPERYGYNVEINLVEFGRNEIREFTKNGLATEVSRKADYSIASFNMIIAGKSEDAAIMDILY